jgi:hypothetical protein
MPDDEAWFRLPLVDRLELVALDLELRRAPRALIEAVWAGVDVLRGRVAGVAHPSLARPASVSSAVTLAKRTGRLGS